MDDSSGMTKAQRLELQAQIAPVLRSASEATKTRRVGLINAKGEVVGYTNGAEALKGLARIQELEHAVVEDKRPKTVICEACGRPLKVPAKGKVPKRCVDGGCRQSVCAGWEGACPDKAAPGPNAFASVKVKCRKGGPWLCRACATRKRSSNPDLADILRRGARKRMENPGYREAHAAILRRRNVDPAFMEQSKNALRRTTKTQEWREKHAEMTRKRHEDPEYVRKHAERLREMHADPDFKKKLAKAARKRAADPEWQKKNANAQAKRRERERAAKQAAE